MWLLVSLSAAVISTLLYATLQRRYRLGPLSVMFWGMTLMILVDHILGYEGGPFLETETEGLVPNSIVLGLLMLLPIMAIWAVLLIIDRMKGIPKPR